jgi:hypothetical protein
MLHPLFSTLIRRPDLLVAHVSAYSALFHQEAAEAGAMLVKRYLAWAVATICGLVFVLFAGIALMIGTLNNQFHWVLLAVPGSALVVMLLAIAKARVPLTETRFTVLKEQIESDIQALRAAS